ncbi:MAG: HD-GYP domain-containing protein (c-di-GMP phosphodiesterase class II) [Alphaproteobacteria bacterium]|jgi:HD-GYP domain-containing protein (c-di-GMP phosphodiesterase class II)
MTSLHASGPVQREVEKRIALRMGFIAVVIAVVAIMGFVLIFSWADAQKKHDLRNWQERIGIVAASRAAAVSAWVAQQKSVIGGLADNTSFQLYASLSVDQIASTGAGEPTPEAQYLENLILVTADRTGFRAPVLGTDVGANIEQRSAAGIALIAPRQRIIVSTQAMPPLPDEIRIPLIAATTYKGAVISNIFAASPDGEPSIAIAAKVLDVRNDREIATVIGVKPVAGELYPLLIQPGSTENTAEAVLLRRTKDTVNYVSPLKDGTRSLDKTLAMTTPDLAAAFAVAEPRSFGLRRDYRNAEVLVTSREIAGTDLVLMYKVDREEALAESDARLVRTLFFMLAVVVIVVVGVLLIWRHGTSQRAARSASMYREMAERFEQQANFIRRLTDSQPNGNFIVDGNGTMIFANERLALSLGDIATDDLAGKSLASIFGPHDAGLHQQHVDSVLETGAAERSIDRAVSGADRILQRHYIPLAETPFSAAAVLVVEEDLTEAITTQERTKRVLKEIVETLLYVVDRRDPYAADQSARVAAIARSVAVEMGLEPVLIETVEQAAHLMNLGKILVPVEILTKEGPLTDDEFALIHARLEEGIDLVSRIEFDGPVVETLRQARERWDGTGEPKGLAGNQILVTARIIAAANAFVAMTSKRAHRVDLSVDDALGGLLNDVGSSYDRRVVVALASFMENRDGRER